MTVLKAQRSQGMFTRWLPQRTAVVANGCSCGKTPDTVLIVVRAACRSDDVGAVALGGMEKEELKGLDVSIFSRAPPQALLATLEHLRCAGHL